ncbi:hypothetical protein HK102_012808, partial [Quaeritorhiza haematococci]
MSLNSVERVKEYLEIDQEPPAVIPECRPPVNWPTKGEIQIQDLVVKYAPDLPPVLNKITVHMHAREKIGVVGRTGAGKSTLTIAFFRFIEPESGTIIIDDIDITKIGLYDLRSAITIIPQDPVLFAGTIRSNLDPFGVLGEEVLWEALRRANLAGHQHHHHHHHGEYKNEERKLVEKASAATLVDVLTEDEDWKDDAASTSGSSSSSSSSSKDSNSTVADDTDGESTETEDTDTISVV